MSKDPYNDVKRDVESSLTHTQSLLQSYTRLTSSSSQARSPEIEATRAELRSTLESLEADLEDLEDSVRSVEDAGSRWGMDDSEVTGRRKFVERVKSEVKDLRKKVMGSKGKGKAQDGGRYRDLPDEEDRIGDDPEEARRWEQEEQQMLVRRQDDTLGVISGTLSSLASQAGLIGQEVGEQSEMLDDLGNRVDHTDSRLRRTTRTLNDFIRKNETTRSNWCIGILIVVLIILLVLVILT